MQRAQAKDTKGQVIRFVHHHCNPCFRALHALWLVGLLLLPLPAPAQETQATLEGLLQQLGTQGEGYIAGETVYDLPVTQQIYAENAYTPAWTNPVALQELSAAIGEAEREGMEGISPRYVQGKISSALVSEKATSSAEMSVPS